MWNIWQVIGLGVVFAAAAIIIVSFVLRVAKKGNESKKEVKS